MGKLLELSYSSGILQSSPEELREIYEVEEGLENRLLAAALEAASFKEFMQN